MEDQNHPKTIPCRQCIKACGRPHHQLDIEMIIKDIIVKRKYYYRICHKVTDSKPNNNNNNSLFSQKLHMTFTSLTQ